jgi:DnaK suppressor protein
VRPSTNDSRPAEDLSLTVEQQDRLRAELASIAAEHRRRAEDYVALFSELVADPGIDVAERQSARLGAAQATEIQEAAEAAIRAIDDGTYGRCATCGKPIPFERLEAIPMTSACVACQT